MSGSTILGARGSDVGGGVVASDTEALLEFTTAVASGGGGVSCVGKDVVQPLLAAGRIGTGVEILFLDLKPSKEINTQIIMIIIIMTGLRNKIPSNQIA